MLISPAQPFGEPADRLGLVAGGCEGRAQSEFGHRAADYITDGRADRS
jgi:hypothetical protein